MIGLSVLTVLALGAMLTAGCARQTLVIPVPITPEALRVAAQSGSIRSYESATRAIASVMVMELGLPLPPRLTVFVYPDHETYAAGLAGTGRMSPRRAEEIAGYSVGLGQHRQLFINDQALRGACRRVWLGVVAHELTHSAQYQLSGGRRGRSEQWLREGMADWVAARVLERLGETTLPRRRNRALDDVARAWAEREDTRLDLIRLGAPLGWEHRHLDAGQLTYRLAFLATDALIRRSGLDRLIGYFRAFADSDDRFGHFERAFGMSLEEFEEEVLTEIRDQLARRERDHITEAPPTEDFSGEVPAMSAASQCRDDAIGADKFPEPRNAPLPSYGERTEAALEGARYVISGGSITATDVCAPHRGGSHCRAGECLCGPR